MSGDIHEAFARGLAERPPPAIEAALARAGELVMRGLSHSSAIVLAASEYSEAIVGETGEAE